MVNLSQPCTKCGYTTHLGQMHCNKCGQKTNFQSITQHCSYCSKVMFYPEVICRSCGTNNDIANYQYPEQKIPTSSNWYFFPILLGVIGGVTAWAILRESDPTMAKKTLILGIAVTTAVILIVGILIVTYSKII